MSAIAGICTFDGAPIDPVWLACAGSALSHRGPDGGSEAIAGPVGMAYRAFQTTPESRRERQPSTRSGIGLLTWDGRLDNRDELRGCLGSLVSNNATDVEYVWAAYERWGAAAFARLIGDFALALWDARLRKLLLTRDCVGTRPLYFHVSSRRIVWSSDLGVLLRTEGVSMEVNDEYVAGFLCRGADTHLTPYAGVHAVKPAHTVVVRDGVVSEDRGWRIDPDREIRYATDAEYEEHFRQLFRESVRARLRTGPTVFAELSGGLDSSAIVCMADTIIASGDAHASRLDTISYVFEGSEAGTDRPWLDHVDRHRGVPSRCVRGEEHPFLKPIVDRSHIVTPSFMLLHSAFLTEVVSQMRGAAARVLLCGIGGHELFYSTSHPGPELADLLYARSFARLHRSARVWSRLLESPYLKLLWYGAVWPLLPTFVRAAAPLDILRRPSWIAKPFARRASMARQMVEPPELAGVKRPSKRDQAFGFGSIVRRIASGQRHELAGQTTAYPFTDRRLVEFLHAIPFEQKLRPGEGRSLMRRALRGVLPPEVLARRGKRHPGEAIARAIAREWPALRALLERGQLVERGYADERKLREALAQAPAGWKQSESLFKAMAVELWLRQLESQRPAASLSVVADHELTASLAMAVRPRSGLTSD